MNTCVNTFYLEFPIWKISYKEPIGITLLSPRNSIQWKIIDFKWGRNNLEDKILAWQRKRKIELREKMQTRRRSPKGRAWNQCENLTLPPHRYRVILQRTLLYLYISFHFYLYYSPYFYISVLFSLSLLLFPFKIPSYPSLSVYNVYMILSS